MGLTEWASLFDGHCHWPSSAVRRLRRMVSLCGAKQPLQTGVLPKRGKDIKYRQRMSMSYNPSCECCSCCNRRAGRESDQIEGRVPARIPTQYTKNLVTSPTASR